MNKKRPDLKIIWLLHHNIKPHTTSIVREFLKKGKAEVLTNPAYKSDLAQAIFGFLEL